MFEIIYRSLRAGIVTDRGSEAAAGMDCHVRGKPVIPWGQWKDARLAAGACPTGAISFQDKDGQRLVSFDLGKCTFCGLCAEADRSVQMSLGCRYATRDRRALTVTARYELDAAGGHLSCVEGPLADDVGEPGGSAGDLGEAIKARAHRLFGRSLHIREVDAGSCNGCEIEIVGLNSPVYDAERFGIHFVASPRHADMLLVTGPVTRNMELALRKTYEAMPGPRLVIAVGTCGCSGGIFGTNYATVGPVESVVPVDVYVPGCPPSPGALLHGILTAIGQDIPQKSG